MPLDAHAFLRSRVSTPSKLLGEPGPDDAQIAALIEIAAHVPDHGRLTPWRFIAIRGEARARLGAALATRSAERNPGDAAVIEKDRQRFAHAPLVLVVVARLTPGHKVPEQEQLLSAGCAAMSLLFGAHALGFGAQWLTGWAAYDAAIAATLGVAADERIVGFVHIGTPRASVEDRARPDPAALLTEWTGA